MSNHARLSPSSPRWVNCPGSVREEAVYPRSSGAAAIDGTGTHLLLEICLEWQASKSHSYLGETIGEGHEDKSEGWLVDQERCDRVQVALDYIDKRVIEFEPRYSRVVVEAESRSDPGKFYGRSDWWGTADVTILCYDADDNLVYLEVIDYKDGKGWVDVQNNSQLVAYARGKMGNHNPSVKTTIIQPKTSTPIRSRDYTPLEIHTLAKELADAAALTDDPDAPLIPGVHCQWCPHKSNCTAQSDKDVQIITDILPTGDPSTLPSDKLRELADARGGIETIFDRAEEELQKRIESGEFIPGYEMRPGRSSNVWNENAESIAKMLKVKKFKKDEIYPPVLVSPAKALANPKLTEKQKEQVKQYVTNKAGKLKLTKVAVRKKLTAEEMFGDVVQRETTVLQSKNKVSFIN